MSGITEIHDGVAEEVDVAVLELRIVEDMLLKNGVETMNRGNLG